MLFDGGLGLGRIVARRQPDANLRARDRNQFVRGVGGGRCVNSEDGHGRAAPGRFRIPTPPPGGYPLGWTYRDPSAPTALPSPGVSPRHRSRPYSVTFPSIL